MYSSVILKLTNVQLDWLCERIPDPPHSPLGGRPAADKRRVIQGIFWMLDNGAKWKDLPSEFGSKSTVHRWFQAWVHGGVFETIMRESGRFVERVGLTNCTNVTSTARSAKPAAGVTASDIHASERA